MTAREKHIKAIEALEAHGKIEHETPCPVCNQLIAEMQSACKESVEEFFAQYPNLLDKH